MLIQPGRHTAAHSGPIVVFLIGMRINQFRRVSKWLPAAKAMPAMLDELRNNPSSGFLGAELFQRWPRTLFAVQYWRDFDSIEAYARNRDRKHWPAWTAFYSATDNNGSVGIFHETYCVDAGRFETIYGDMPPFGLGQVSGTVPATGVREAARGRMTAVMEE